MVFQFNVVLFCFVAATCIANVLGELNSTFALCSQSEIQAETFKLDYWWTIYGMPQLFDDLNLRNLDSREKTEFVTNTSSVRLPNVPGTWYFVFRKRRDDQDNLRIVAVYQVMKFRDQNFTVQSNMAVTFGPNSMLAEKYTSDDKNRSRVYEAASTGNSNNLTTYLYEWYILIDDFAYFLEGMNVAPKTPTATTITTPATSANGRQSTVSRTDGVNFTFTFNITKMSTPQFVPTDLKAGKACKLPNYDTLVKSFQTKGRIPYMISPTSLTTTTAPKTTTTTPKTTTATTYAKKAAGKK